MASIIDISGVSEDALNLKVMMDGVLERAVSVFESYNVPLPERKYWTMGEPAIDCAQLVVSFVQMYLGLPGDEASQAQRCNMPRTAVLTITVAREVPTVSHGGRPPSGDSIERGSYISAVDSWVLMESMKSFDPWDETGLGAGVIATVEAGSPAGGFQVSTMQISMVIP
jgi:hypothetical protein